MGDKKGASFVYARIGTFLRNQIFSGELKPGDPLPSENQLCSEFEASRETVRKGLHRLETEGLIHSVPKVGYFVSTPNHRDVSLTFSEDLAGCTSFYRDIHGIYPDENLQEILGISQDQKVIEFSQITRDSQNTPVSFEIKYVPYERAYPSVESEIRFAVLPDATLSKIATYDYYIELSVSAAGATAEVADSLGCTEGEPMLLIERTYIRQDGKRISYELQYLRQPHRKLCGISGSVKEKRSKT